MLLKPVHIMNKGCIDDHLPIKSHLYFWTIQRDLHLLPLPGLLACPLRRCFHIIDAPGILPRLEVGILFGIIIKELYLKPCISRISLMRRPQENTAVAAFREPVLQLPLKIVIGLRCRQPSTAGAFLPLFSAALGIKNSVVGMPAAGIASHAGPTG